MSLASGRASARAQLPTPPLRDARPSLSLSPSLAYLTSSLGPLTTPNTNATVGASFAATVVGALVLGSAADKIDPALLEDGGASGGAGGGQSGPRRARSTLAAEQQQQQQKRQLEGQRPDAAEQQQQLKQGDGGLR